jgi:hypothetical protein
MNRNPPIHPKVTKTQILLFLLPGLQFSEINQSQQVQAPTIATAQLETKPARRLQQL